MTTKFIDRPALCEVIANSLNLDKYRSFLTLSRLVASKKRNWRNTLGAETYLLQVLNYAMTRPEDYLVPNVPLAAFPHVEEYAPDCKDFQLHRIRVSIVN